MTNDFIQAAPERCVPGSSNLSLLAVASNYDKALVERVKPIDIGSFDVQQWDVHDANTGRRILAYEVNYASRTNRTYSTVAYFDKSQHRAIHVHRPVYAPEAEGEESDRGSWISTIPATSRTTYRDNEWKRVGLMHIDDALRIIITTFLPHTARMDFTMGRDPLAAIRGLTSEEVRSLAQWMWHADHLDDNYFPPPLEETLAIYAVYAQRVADCEAPNTVGIGAIDGSGRAMYVSSPSAPAPRYDGVRDITADVIDFDGLLHMRVELGSVNIEPESPAWYAILLASKLDAVVIRALNHIYEPCHTFAGLDDHGPDVYREMCAFIGDDTVRGIDVWARLVANYRTAGSLPVVAHTNFEFGWMRKMISDETFPVALQISEALRYGQQIQIGALDIAEFAKTAVPDNPLVESVTMLKNGKVRVVLRDPVYPEFVLRRGATYTENEPGTVLSYMAVHAFDLDFRGTLTQFPSATAYADAECTKTARHTNITSAGHVCLGDINTVMSKEEIEARGGVAMPCVMDFVQMLKQCNLDSAYHTDKEFVLLDPESVTDTVWRSKEWDIPGLRRVDQHMDDFKAFLAAMSTSTTEEAAADEAAEGEGE